MIQFKTMTDILTGNDLLESERYINVLDCYNIHKDKKYIVLNLYSSYNRNTALVLIFGNFDDYITIKGTIESLFININFN